MRHRQKSFAAACSAFIILGAASGCNKGAPSGSVPSEPGVAATVNGETITTPEFDTYMGMKQTVQVLTPQGLTQMHASGTFGIQAMQELVDQKILMDMAKDEGVFPSDKDVDDEMAFQLKLRPDYVSVLEQAGMSMPMIRRELEVGLAREHLIMKGVHVGDAEVDKYVKDHPDKFLEPETANLLFIQVGTAAKQSAVDAALAKGTKFGEVARQLSDDPHAKETGGLFGQTVVKSMQKEIRAVVKATPEGQASGWTKFGKIFVKFFVTKKTPAKQKAPDSNQREIIRRSLAMLDGQLKNNFDQEFYKRLKQAKVEISVPYLKDAWQRSWDQLVAPNSLQAPPSAPLPAKK